MQRTSFPQRLFQFFRTEKGRQVAFYVTTASSIGLFVGKFSQHTLLLHKYREIVASYRNGEERTLSNSIRQRWNQAVDILNVSDFEKRLLKPFIVFGFDLFHAGSTKYKYGGHVGIPSNFYYNSVSDIEKSEICFRGQPVNWSSESGKILEEAIVLAEDEQVFGMMREILQLRTQQILLQAIYPAFSIFSVYTIANVINQKMLLFHKPFGFRGVLYTILGLFGYGIYSLMTDMTNVYYESETDKTLAGLGIEVADAGVRFYDKILKKNIAIRKITDENTYSALGNENFLVRHRSLPLTVRKAFFESKLKEYEEQRDKKEG